MTFAPGPRHRVQLPILSSFRDEGGTAYSGPSSGALTTNLALFCPLSLLEPFTVAKAFWVNGATASTDFIDVGAYLMTDMATGRMDLIRSTGAILSAGANVVQASSTWRVAAANITTGVDSTDGTTFTTASVTLKAGRMYLMSFVNTAASADVISGITGGPTWTLRSTTQYNTAAHRVSIWSGVPTADYTGTIVVSFGATQTGGRWSLNEFSGVDTSTNDGVVQAATPGTGNSTTPLATLAAFGSANNATFGALGNVADNTTTPGTGFTELSDLTTTTTPGSFLQTQWRVDNDTTVDGTITSGQWGACAVEIKADTTTPFVLPATLTQNLYFAIVVTGTTATFFRSADTAAISRAAGRLGLAGAFPLPSSCIPTAATTQRVVAGFSNRTLLD